MAELPSGTVTFLFTDIEGSTARWEQQPEAMRVALARHDGLIRAAIIEHGGHVVKTTGDGFHAAFARAPDAVAAAMTAQLRLAAEPWNEIGGLRVRMALHTGAAEERNGDYYGPTVNLASRLAELAVPKELLVVPAVAAEARSATLRFEPAGKRMLKGFAEPVALLTVERAGVQGLIVEPRSNP